MESATALKVAFDRQCRFFAEANWRLTSADLAARHFRGGESYAVP